ncbi:DNA ligase [Marinicrinis lubricantis]
MLTYYDGNEVKLINRRLNERTSQYPELTNISAYCSAKSVILDGEIIALDEGRPSFYQVMRRDGIKKQQNIERAVKQIPITYMIFDILYCDGDWVLEKSLEMRQHLLRKIITPSMAVQLVDNYPESENLLEVMRQHQMEGIVLKDLSSSYSIGGKDQRWQKKKVFKDLNAAVGGVTFRGKTVNSLILGLYDDDGRFWYIGHAGSGKLSVQDWREVTAVVPALQMQSRPFENLPERWKGAVWLKPALTVKVQYLEWTPHQTLRHPTIQAFVSFPPDSCTFRLARET